MNLEIMEYFKDIKGFNGVFLRNDLPNLKNGAHVINLDHSKNTGAHWVAIFVKKNEVIYFDSFGAECISKEIMTRTKNKNIKTSIFILQNSNSIMFYLLNIC